MVENLLVRFLFSIEGFVVTILLILYIFRKKKTDMMPSTLRYDYEGAASNPKLDEQINRNDPSIRLLPATEGRCLVSITTAGKKEITRTETSYQLSLITEPMIALARISPKPMTFGGSNSNNS